MLGKEWQPFGGAGFLVPILFLSVSVLISATLMSTKFLLTPKFNTLSKSKYYFASIGLGFTMIEVSFIHSFILLLDNPAYAFTVVVAILLVFSGLGSMISPVILKRFKWIIPVIILLVVVYRFLTFPFIHLILQFSLINRIIIAALLVSPLGILMGIPFPWGLSIIKRDNASLIPWAWAVNGYASAIAALLVILIGLRRIIFLNSLFFCDSCVF